MRDWKTTICGLIAALCGFILFEPGFFPEIVVAAAKYIGLGGLAGLGITAQQVRKE